MASFDSWQDSGLTPTLSLMGGRDLRGSCTRGKSKTMRVIWQSRERACVRVHALSLSVVRRGGWGMGPTFIHIHLVSCHEHRQHKGRIEDPLWQGIMVMGTLVKRSKANCRYSYPAHTTRLAACRKKMKTCKKYKYKYSQTSPAGTDCLFLFPTLFHCLQACHIFCGMNLFVHASESGIISSDAQSILGTSQSAGNCAPSLLNTVHERAEWMMNSSIRIGLLECYKQPGLFFLFFLCLQGGGRTHGCRVERQGW